MKILHCSDIHLGKKPFGTKEFSQKRYKDFFDAFNKMVNIAIERKVEVFIVAGDLFDKKEITPDILNRSEEIFRKLKENNIHTIITEGNHDNISNDDEINSWQNYLEEKDYVQRGSYKIIDGEYQFKKIKIKDVNFYGLGYPGFAIDNVLEELGKILSKNEKNYIIVHTAISGSDFLPGLVNPDTLGNIQEKVIYIAGGHLHSHSVFPAKDPFFFVPGSLEYWDIKNDKGQKKGGIIFDSETKNREFVEISPRERIITDFYMVKGGEDEYLLKFEEFAKNLNLDGEQLVIVNIICDHNEYINTVSFEKILESNGALKAFVNIKQKKKNGNIQEDDKNITYSIKEMEKNIIESWNFFKNSHRIADYLEEYKNIQEEKDRGEDFLLLFDKMLEEELADESK
ncbi:metallophosphoesterase family protein [Fusobacterium sp. PH5-44]|uniref:metallophosphoesterase family protein n=1 Tax=unclassified Fusobacterium TaxID=2648384 RepID=UPI003D205AF9